MTAAVSYPRATQLNLQTVATSFIPKIPLISANRTGKQVHLEHKDASVMRHPLGWKAASSCAVVVVTIHDRSARRLTVGVALNGVARSRVTRAVSRQLSTRVANSTVAQVAVVPT